MLKNRTAFAVAFAAALLVADSSARAVTISVSTDVLNGGSSAYGNVADSTTSATNEINYVKFIPNNANPAAVVYDNTGNTVNLAPNIYAAGAARGPGQGIEVNGYAQSNGGIGSTIPANDTNLFLAGQSNANNPGFGAHANWVVTLNLDKIRADHFGGSTPLSLTGQFGAWGAIGDQSSSGGNVQGEILLDGKRIDSMTQASFSPINNPLFNLYLPSAGHELSFLILNSPTSSNWDDGIYQAVNLTAVPEPSALILLGLGAVGLFLARRRRNK